MKIQNVNFHAFYVDIEATITKRTNNHKLQFSISIKIINSLLLAILDFKRTIDFSIVNSDK